MDALSLQVLIVDDEPLARKKIRRWLQDDPDIHVIEECGNGFDAVEHLAARPIDLLFLDIEMPEMDGFAVLEQVEPERMPLVIFVTAYDRYAIDAFELHALDYLLKPYDRPRFNVSLTRAKRQIQQRQQEDISQQLSQLLKTIQRPQHYLTRFVVKTRERVLLVDAEQVDWIEADGNYVMLHIGSRTHLVREAIGKLADKLDPTIFPRIHRSTMLNINRVKELYPASHGDYVVVLQDNTELFMSRTYRDKLRDLLQIPL